MPPKANSSPFCQLKSNAKEGQQITLSPEQYTVGWICALPDTELKAARQILDNEHTQPSRAIDDGNSYVLGSIGKHNIVIACTGGIGNINATVTGISMRRTFKNIRFGLLVGIGGGIPRVGDHYYDIRLGDIAVSYPDSQGGGVIQYDFGRDTDGTFQRTGTLNKPPRILRTSIDNLRSRERVGKEIKDMIEGVFGNSGDEDEEDEEPMSYPKDTQDILFKADYPHHQQNTTSCRECVTENNEIVREPRKTKNPRIFYGNIASGSSVLKNAARRDALAIQENVICVEMEAAGLMDDWPCIVIRGISDYTDSHKNWKWQPYAAAVAAVYAKILLEVIPPEGVQELEPIRLPHYYIPFERNQSFVGREAQLRELEWKTSSSIFCQKVGISGLGGTGKSALAIEFAYQMQKKRPKCSIFWVPVVNHETFEQAYQRIAECLEIPELKKQNPDIKTLVKSRLSEESFGEWLLIIDNADDADILVKGLEGQSKMSLMKYLPSSTKGSIIFTTRNRKTISDDVHDMIELGRLPKTEAKQAFQNIVPRIQYEDGTAVDGLLDLLECLPLAIVQAASFMKKNGTSVDTYTTFFNREEDKRGVLSEEFRDSNRYEATVKNPISTTWYISFYQIQRDDKLAVEYLSYIACLVREAIPESLAFPGESTVEREKAIGTLKSYSFITQRQLPDQLEALYDMHRLVHWATREWLKEEKDLLNWTEKTIERLIQILPYGDYDKKETWKAYLPHAVQLVSSQDPEERLKMKILALLHRIGKCYLTLRQDTAAEGIYREWWKWNKDILGKEHADTLLSMSEVSLALSNQGKYAEAEKMDRETLELREKVLGKEHPDTLTSMHNLAQTLRDQGKYAEAEKMHWETFELKEKVLGKEHPSTLTSMHNLAHTLSSQGKYIEAEKMYQETLVLREKVSGKEHPHTLTSMHNLAQTLRDQGKYAEAEKIHRETLELKEKVLGKEHPDTLTSINNLAHILNNQGEYAEAEKMDRETLELREKVLGKEHPDTLTSMHNLAQTLRDQGKYAEAEKMDQETLELREKVLGKEHPDTLTSMHNLAQTLRDQEKYAEAEKMHWETFELKEKVLGKEHPSTLTSMHNLAHTLSSQSKYIEAEKMYQETLVLREKVLGKEHPHTLTSMHNLAQTLRDQGKYAEAEKMDRETLELREKVLGKEHPSTLTSMHNLAHTLSSQSKYIEAEKMYQETLVLREKVSGKEHPHTLTSMHNLAQTLRDQGKYAEAEKMHRETLELREKVLGKEHPSTLTSINNLAYILNNQGEYAEAENMHRETLELREKVLGKEHPDTLTSMHNLAQTLRGQGKYAKAEKMDRETLELSEKVLGKEHPDTLTSMHNLAQTLRGQGKYAKAEKMDRETLELSEKVLGKEHPDTLTSMHNLAQTLRDQGKYAEAEKMHREELTLSEKVLGKEHPHTLTSMHNLAQTLRDQGKYAEAEKMHREELTLSEKVLGKEHPDTLTSIQSLALALSSQGKYAEAEKMHREELTLSEKVLGKEHPHTLTSMHNLAQTLRDQGKYAEAEKMHRETFELKEKVLGKEHPSTLTSRHNLAGVLSDQGKYTEAEKMYQETLELREKVLGKEHPHTLTSMNNLALALSKQGKMSREVLQEREMSDKIAKERTSGVIQPAEPAIFLSSPQTHTCLSSSNLKRKRSDHIMAEASASKKTPPTD